MNNKITFTSKFINGKALKDSTIALKDSLLDAGRAGDMSRGMFIATAFTFLLSGRLIKSRDKDEVRETLVRDVPTFVIAVMGVPWFGKMVTKEMQKIYGFALTEKTKIEPPKQRCINWPKSWQDKYKIFGPKKFKTSVAGIDQLHDWYVLDKDLHSGFKGFTQRLDDLGGNFKKIFSTLDKDIKTRLKDFSSDNKTFMEELSKVDSKTDPDMKIPKLKDEIIEMLKNHKNRAADRAEFMGAIPKIAGFFITLGLIGILIPKSNIWLTERINKKKAAKENALNEPKPVLGTKVAQPSQFIQPKKTMENFAGKN